MKYGDGTYPQPPGGGICKGTLAPIKKKKSIFRENHVFANF
jgi:hypothetical protein